MKLWIETTLDYLFIWGGFIEFVNITKITKYGQPHPLKPLLKTAVK